MKAQIKKSKTTAKPALKTTAKAAGKPAAQPKKKSAVLPKKAAKPVAKPIAKAKAAPAPVKSKTKAAVVAKKAVKSAPKQTALKKAPITKVAPKKAASKPVAKAVLKPVKKAVAPAAKAKPAAKPAAKLKTTAPVAAKATSKQEVKIKAKPSVSPADKGAPKAVVAVQKVASPAPAAAVASNGLPPPPPLKPGRRSSSRAFAHMPPPAPMVPTHAPDAAKASYSTMIERVIAPPPHVAAKKDPKLANNWKTKAAEALSDDEVKAMPDAEYMNEKQLAFFRAKLSVLKQEIHNSAGATTEHLREDTVVVPDPADRATIEEEHALELRTRDRERKLLKKIEQSIGRIDSGDYGYCDETGEPIGVGRLIARPTASLSLEAQQRRELKQKMFGD